MPHVGCQCGGLDSHVVHHVEPDCKHVHVPTNEGARVSPTDLGMVSSGVVALAAGATDQCHSQDRGDWAGLTHRTAGPDSELSQGKALMGAEIELPEECQGAEAECPLGSRHECSQEGQGARTKSPAFDFRPISSVRAGNYDSTLLVHWAWSDSQNIAAPSGN